MSSSAQDTLIDENARYKRVIRAAEELFKKVGFRAVTMELVAREANVAKATLYSYFKNKDELYMAVCARMARILRGSVEQALAKPDTPLDERLADAMIAKHRPVFTLVRASPHATELLSYTHSMAGEIFRESGRGNAGHASRRHGGRPSSSSEMPSNSRVRFISAARLLPAAARPPPKWSRKSAPLPAPIWPVFAFSPERAKPQSRRASLLFDLFPY